MAWLVLPPPPLIKVASNTRPCSKLGGTTLYEREEGGQYYTLSHSLVNSSNLKQESSFFCRNVSTFLQLVVHVASNPWHFRIKCVKTIFSQMTNIFGYHRILKVVQWFCAPENIWRHYTFYDCFSVKDPNWGHCLNRIDWQRDKS